MSFNKEVNELMLNAFNYDTGSSLLFKAIENKDWVSALAEINNNTASVRQWHFRMDPKSNTLKWKATTVHAAIVHGAPAVIMEALLAAFPDAAKLSDDQGMLPLHLAYRQAAADDVMAIVYRANPQAVFQLDAEHKKPIDYVQMKSEKRWMSYLHMVAPTADQAKLIKTKEEWVAKKEELTKLKKQLESELNGETASEDEYLTIDSDFASLKLSDKFLLRTTMVGSNDFLN